SHVGKRRKSLGDQREAELRRVEGHRRVDIVDHVADVNGWHDGSSSERICLSGTGSSSPGGARAYWENLTLSGQRKVMALQMCPASLKLVEMTRKLGGAEARELDEIANQVRLIKESAVYGEATPFRCRRLSCAGEDAVKSLDPLEELRRETNGCLEHRDESTITQTDTLSDVVDGRDGGLTEGVESERHHSPSIRATREPCRQRRLEDTELVERTGRVPEPLENLAG